jgi:type II secretion system protein N
MRFPKLRLRLPRLRGLPRPNFDALGGVLNRTVLLYAAYTLALFLVFSIVNFPHDVVVRRALTQLDLGPLQLDFKSARFAWHRGYELRGIQVSQPPVDVPVLEVSSVQVLPELRGLMRGEFTGISLRGDLYGGSADGQWTIAGQGGSGQVTLSQLDLGRYRPLTMQLDEGQVSGQVSGAFTVDLSGGRRAAQVTGEVSVNRPGMVGAKVRGFKLPDLQFAQAKGKLTLKGDRLEIQEFRASGDMLGVQGSGSIVLRDPPETSQLNLRVTFEQSAATPPEIKGALALVPRAPNARPDAPITITGTFAAPQFR